MEDKLHPVEAAWRRFRGSEAMALFRECLKRADAAIKSLGLRRLPVEVVLPGLVPYSLVPLLQGRSPFDQRDVKLTMANELMANSIHVWAAYREAKTIYRVEPSLTSCFAHTFWPEAAPTEALRLPSRCTIVAAFGQGTIVLRRGIRSRHRCRNFRALGTALERIGWSRPTHFR